MGSAPPLEAGIFDDRRALTGPLQMLTVLNRQAYLRAGPHLSRLRQRNLSLAVSAVTPIASTQHVRTLAAQTTQQQDRSRAIKRMYAKEGTEMNDINLATLFVQLGRLRFNSVRLQQLH